MEAIVPDDNTPHPLTPDMRQAAFDLASKGLKVFPIQPRGKLPIKGMSWKSLVCEDEFSAYERWSTPAFSDCNVGVHCDGLVVVDIDDYKAATDSGVLADLDLPVTFEVATARGGRHLYFAGPDIANSAGKLGPGIDVRGVNGYVVGPGSVTENGTYRIVRDVPIAEAPAALIERCKAARQAQHREVVDWSGLTSAARLEDGRQYLATARVSVEGCGGNTTAFQVISELWDRGVTAQGAFELLTEEGGWNDRCLPPWSYDELRQLIHNAFTYAQNDFGCRAADNIFGHVVIPAPEPVAPRQNSLLACRHFGHELMARPPRETEWIVEDRVLANDVTLLYGDGGVGKSWLALQLAASVATGKPWLGLEVRKPGKAFYLSAEDDHQQVTNRLHAVASGLGADREALRNLQLFDVSLNPVTALATFDREGAIKDTEIWKDLVELVRSERPALMIVDTLTDAFAGNEIDKLQVKAFIHRLRVLAKTAETAIVVLGHPSMSGLESGRGTSGSTAWNNSTRMRLFLQKDPIFLKGGKLDPDRRILTAMKTNYGQEGATLTVKWAKGFGYMRLDEAEAAARPEEAKAAFLECLKDSFSRGVFVTKDKGRGYAPKDFSTMPQAQGFNPDDLKKAMEQLEAEGIIRKASYRKDGKDRFRLELSPAAEVATAGSFTPADLFVEPDEPTAEHLAALAYQAIFTDQGIASDSVAATAKRLRRLDQSLAARYSITALSELLQEKLGTPVQVHDAWVKYLAESNGKPGAPRRLIVID
jgi:RecA-family ATPase